MLHHWCMTTTSLPVIPEFGARLAHIRWAMGWNQKRAAVECGISQSTWARYEAAGGPDLYGIAEKVSARTGWPMGWLLDVKDFDRAPQQRNRGGGQVWAPRDSNPDTTDSIMRSARQLLTV